MIRPFLATPLGERLWECHHSYPQDLMRPIPEGISLANACALKPNYRGQFYPPWPGPKTPTTSSSPRQLPLTKNGAETGGPTRTSAHSADFLSSRRVWLQELDSNQRPPGYEPGELTSALPCNDGPTCQPNTVMVRMVGHDPTASRVRGGHSTN